MDKALSIEQTLVNELLSFESSMMQKLQNVETNKRRRAIGILSTVTISPLGLAYVTHENDRDLDASSDLDDSNSSHIARLFTGFIWSHQVATQPCFFLYGVMLNLKNDQVVEKVTKLLHEWSQSLLEYTLPVLMTGGTWNSVRVREVLQCFENSGRHWDAPLIQLIRSKWGSQSFNTYVPEESWTLQAAVQHTDHPDVQWWLERELHTLENATAFGNDFEKVTMWWKYIQLDLPVFPTKRDESFWQANVIFKNCNVFIAL